MVKKITAILLICISTILLAQEKKKEPAKTPAADKKAKPVMTDKIYSEQILEDFETAVYTTEKNLSFRKVGRQQAELSIRDQFPAPTGASKKYLGIKMFGRRGDAYTITPAKEILIDKKCRSISVWVYGKRFSGQLSIYIQDVKGDNHRLILGNLSYLGWRKLTIKIPKYIKQQDEYLTKKSAIKITKIIYRPSNSRKRLPIWQYFYIDNISALVREKYTDRQSDDW